MNAKKTISQLLDKIENYDKDERYMATSDLCEVLKKHAAASNTAAAMAAASANANDSTTTSATSNSTSIQKDVEMSDGITPTIDTASERRICEAVLRRVDDSSNDVQAIAVKTLGVLVTCVHEDQVVTIADRLGKLVLDKSKSALRDVYAIGLRTLVTTVPMKMGDIVSNRLTVELMKGISQNSSVIDTATGTADKDVAKVAEEITLACLEILTDLVTRFGALDCLSRLHENLLEVTMKQLASKSHLIRKRSSNTIGCLSVVLSDDLLRRLVDNLLSQIDRSDGIGKNTRRSKRLLSKVDSSDDKPTDTTALIRTMCTVSGHVGHRLTQEQIDRLVPIFLKFCNPDDALAGDDRDDDDSDDNSEENMETEEEIEAKMTLANELRESCFNGFQSFVLRRPKEVRPHLPDIIYAALAYMRYDPNYSYGDEDQDDEEDKDDDDYDMSDEDEDAYEDDEDDFSDDDDDDSWKVRRSAIRTLVAVVEASEKNLSALWTDKYSLRKNKKWKTTVAGALVNRFKERDENCRVDIIECFNNLLRSTIKATANGDVAFTSDDMVDDTAKVVIDIRSNYAREIVNGCEKQLSMKKVGAQTKSAALSLLSTLCTAPGGIGGEDKITSLCQNIKFILLAGENSGGSHGSNKQLKLDALCLVRVIISCDQHDPVDVKKGVIGVLLDGLCKAVQENWYKIISESLELLSALPMLLVDAKSDQNDMTTVTNILYGAIEPRLAANDFDQEIKESALKATGCLISTLHDSLSPPQKERLLSLILLRLKNETTRIAAIKIISKISVESKDGLGKVDLSPIITDYVAALGFLLRQNNRFVKQNTVTCLKTIIRSYGTETIEASDGELMGMVLRDLCTNLIDSDLHIIHLSLQASLAILVSSSSCSGAVNEYLLPVLLQLCTFPSLQDKALDSLLAVFDKLIVCNFIGFNDLLVSLQSRVPIAPKTVEEKENHNEASTKKVIGNIAKCIASIAAAANEEQRGDFVSKLMITLESSVTPETLYESQLALRLSGDLGCVFDLSTMVGVTDRLQAVYIASLDSAFEDIKNAGAYGLGRACAGSVSTFLPRILFGLDENNEKEKKKYLLLSALRELIICHRLGYGSDNMAPVIQEITPHLKRHFSDNEESIRTMVADCMGSLACVQPDDILPQLNEMVQDNTVDALKCWTIATSVKLAISGGCNGDHLLPFMPTFLNLLRHDDLNVKNAALLMVYTAVHHNTQLVLPFLQKDIQPALFELATLKMKRTIDLGPFKEHIDDALSLRKAAISIISACLDKCPSNIDVPAFMPILAAAIGDVEDVQLQAHQIVLAMCPRYPQEISVVVESFVEPLEKTIFRKPFKRVGIELERLNEWKKSAVRVLLVVSKVRNVMENRKFVDLLAKVKKTPESLAMMESLEE